MGRRSSVVIGVLATLCVAAPAASAQNPGQCQAMTVRPDGAVVMTERISTITHASRYGTNTALWTSVRGVSCEELAELLRIVLPAPDERVALEASGWRLTRIDRFDADGVRVHQVWATSGARRVIYTRRGRDLRIGGSVFRAGQRVVVGPPNGGCTAAFVVRVLSGTVQRHLGLTAGHCGDAIGENVIRRDAPGAAQQTTLGTVQFNALPGERVDAMVFALAGTPWAAQQIDRGRRRPPLRVVGWVSTREQPDDRVVCFAGRTSGVDRCGRIYRHFQTPDGEHLICAHVDARPGDSGGPVYTRPRNGTTRAAGIVTAFAASPLEKVFKGERGDLCYTTIQRILSTLHVELPTGSFATADRVVG